MAKENGGQRDARKTNDLGVGLSLRPFWGEHASAEDGDRQRREEMVSDLLPD